MVSFNAAPPYVSVKLQKEVIARMHVVEGKVKKYVGI